MKLIYTCIFLVMASMPLVAGGSIALSEIEPLLNQQPELWQSFRNNFDIQTMGWAPRIGGRRPLDGSRIAPYSFPAKLKGQPGPYDLWLVVQAQTYYFDAQGKLTDMDHGTSFKEVLTLIGIKPDKLPSVPTGP